MAEELDEQVELLSLIGDIALKDGSRRFMRTLPSHVAMKSVTGGHLLEAHVRPTCELILTESPAPLQKRFDPESGLALIRFSSFRAKLRRHFECRSCIN